MSIKPTGIGPTTSLGQIAGDPKELQTKAAKATNDTGNIANATTGPGGTTGQTPQTPQMKPLLPEGVGNKLNIPDC